MSQHIHWIRCDEQDPVRVVLCNALNEALYDRGSFFETIETRLQPRLTDACGNDGHICGATITDIAYRDATTTGESFGISQILRMTLSTAPVTIDQNDLGRGVRHQ